MSHRLKGGLWWIHDEKVCVQSCECARTCSMYVCDEVKVPRTYVCLRLMTMIAVGNSEFDEDDLSAGVRND